MQDHLKCGIELYSVTNWSHQVLQVVLLAYCPFKISMLELRQWTCTTSAALVISFDMFLGSVFVLEQS